MWDCLITNILTELQQSPETKEVRTNKLDAFCQRIIHLIFIKSPWVDWTFQTNKILKKMNDAYCNFIQKLMEQLTLTKSGG